MVRPERFVWDLDWNLLRTFMVIVEEQGITRAAERLSLKQPSVSNALKRLERHFGRRLIERGANRFALTEAGRLIYDQSVDMFDTVARLPVAMRDVREEVTGHVAVSVASHVVSPLFDEALATFHARHPQATLTIAVSQSIEVAKLVRERRASFGICLVSQRDAALGCKLVYREFFGFFCGPTHRLFRSHNLSLRDLKGETSVSFQTDTVFDALWPVATLRKEAHLDTNVIGISSNLEEVRRMIIAGLGIGPLPIHVVRRDVEDGLLWRLPPYEAPPAIDIFLLTNPKKVLNRAERALLTILTGLIEATPLDQRTYTT